MTAVTEEVATVELNANAPMSIHDLHRIRSAVTWYINRSAEPYKFEGVFSRTDMTYPTVVLDSTSAGTQLTLAGNQDLVAKTLAFFCKRCAEWNSSNLTACEHLRPGSSAVIKKSHKDSAEFDVTRYTLKSVPKQPPAQLNQGVDPQAEDVGRWLLEQILPDWR